jgi:diguanylate cyclase (GGDEF)-like protein
MEQPTGSWLCPAESDRARMLEAGSRLRVSRLIVAVIIALALLACVPWFGPWPLVLFPVAAVQVATLDRRLRSSRDPERLVALSILFTAVMVAVVAAMTGGAASPVLSWLVIPGAMMANRFRRTVVIAGFAALAALLAVACVAADPGALADDPTNAICALTALVSIVILTLSLGDTALRLRADARFDHLTGLLNRAALAARFADLRSHAHATDGSIALIVYDLDHFKSVNDDYGHERGDAVLRDTALVLRSHLRAFDLVYRLGGEEFAVVLPGATAAEAHGIAERQRQSLEAARPGGLAMTISGGVAASRGTAVEWETLFRRADGALLDAKRAGRNRILAAGEAGPASLRPAA